MPVSNSPENWQAPVAFAGSFNVRDSQAAVEAFNRLMFTALQQPTQPVPSQAKPATEHLFVSNVRFLSMAAVVFVHCISASFLMAGLSPSGELERVMRQPVSFDIIGFFLISGFLMSEGLTKRSPGEYLKRRLRRIFLPWLFWYLLFFASLLINDAMLGRLRVMSLHEDAQWALHRLVFCLFSSVYWFVPNLLIALCILLACRRFLFDLRLGGALLALSLFYGVNIYAHWIPFQGHSEALLGFIFYLWLGAWAARNFGLIQALNERIPALSLMVLGALAGLAALLESGVLFAAGNPHPMNTLRICNQAYSVVLILAIFKLRKPVWPRAVNVRTTTFGIYLIHIIVLSLLTSVIKQPIGKALAGQTWGWAAAAAVCLSLGVFAVVYGVSLFLTQWALNNPRLRWMVGAPLSS